MATPLKTTPYAALRRFARGARDRARRAKNDLAWSFRKRGVARAMEPVAPLPSGDALRGTTLFFVPYAGVTPMFAQACVVARTLRERGNAVIFARCFRVFERCPVMDMHRLPYDATAEKKLETCLHCADNSLSMLAQYGLDAVDLRRLVTPEMTARIDEALARAPHDLLQFEFEGLRFGALSVMDLVLALKVSDFSELLESDRRVWLQYLRSCLLSHLIVERACRELEVGRIVHVNDYSLLLGARTAARKRGVPCYGLAFPGHRNVDLRRYLILSNVWKPSAFKLLAAWPACRELPLEDKRVREVAEDLLVRLRGVGSHLYSPGKTVHETDVRQRLGLSSERKLLVAYSSSLDELIASRMMTEALGIAIPDRPQPFRDQIEWLTALVQYVEHSDDLALVVRIHPREGVNKRESVASQHLSRLRAAFGGTYAHCRFVWPTDPVSSYDVGEAADVVLTSWSNIGLEMARLGAPVLVAFNGAGSPIPQDDFCEWGATPADFFAKLRELLDRPVSAGQIARAFRWYSLLTLGTTLDLTDLVPRSNFAELPVYQMPLEAAAIEQIVIGGKDVCDLNIERLKASRNAQSEDRESDELLRQLRRLVHFLMTGEDSTDDVPLYVRPMDRGACCTETQPGGTSRAIECDGQHAAYRDGERVYRRYSPMAVRLSHLCGRELTEPAPVGGRQ
ncbi:MAG TPA: hypothetical protein VMR25_23090 [Planctomycetaceae bacterium]|jgi:hypothetical protein|nr:hypothetical protein [Planctomycetaceae bacterium]